MEDHLHLLVDIHPSIALSDFVKEIKLASSLWIKKEGLFPAFRGWNEGYCAITYSIKEKDNVINYIKNQEMHHAKMSFADELKKILNESGVEYNDKFFLQ